MSLRCAGDIDTRSLEEMFINLDPIQAGGRLTSEAMKAVIAYADGYSVCDNCQKPARLDAISKPPLATFHKDLAAFVEMDEARLMPGARRGFQAVASSFVNPGDPVLVTSYCHYTTFVAVEVAGGVVYEIAASPDHYSTPDMVAERIEEVIAKTKRTPALLFLEEVDYQYGNVHPVKEMAAVAHQYDIPVLYNGAYTVGIKEVSGADFGVDFVVGSGHKSMAAPAPSGFLATRAEYADVVFRTSKVHGDLTGRNFPVKEVELLGCTLMGNTSVGMMASFPHVKERVKHFDKEVARANKIIDALLSIEGMEVVSEYPRKHTLTRMNSEKCFDPIAKKHKKRGFFLISALRERHVTGIIPGSTKVWKMNSFGLTDRQADWVADAFLEIAEAEGLHVNR
ncbi:MAG: O-phospho-L-seryl-tRNA:Cys-tRNA synthase [Methanomicrobiales archaeon]|jgi:Sep-tRNA:Cys-tRNA synthetase|nr:O-phospho-L-seryl-tRNA:Cys-tRNA synthase [Methanomicrobiales archaeon]